MFENVKKQWGALRYSRHGAFIQKSYNKMMENAALKCAYCHAEFGIANDVYAVDFLGHLLEKHSDEIEDKKEIEKINEKLKKIFNG